MFTRQMQIQAIADRLAGMGEEEGGFRATARQFTEPWRSCWVALDKAVPGEGHIALFKALQNLPEQEEVIHAILAACPGAGSNAFESLRELSARLPPVEWLWPGWVPRGMITLLGAVPGAGKSFLALDLARRIIHGQPFPDGRPTPRPGANVLYVDAEAIPQLINARAAAWKMDTSRLYLMLPEADGLIDFSLPACRDRLIEMAARLSPELVIIDSLSSISSKGENNVEDVRLLLSFLNVLAQDFQVGLVLIHHLKKGSSLQEKTFEMTMDDFRGSGHIIAMSRSVMGLSVVQTSSEPDRNGPRRLEIVKTNLGAYPDPLGFEMEPLQPSGAYLKWGAPPKAFRNPTLNEACKDWLEEILQEGELHPKEVIEQAKEAGFKRSMVFQAREELGRAITNTHGRRHPKNAWKWVERD